MSAGLDLTRSLIRIPSPNPGGSEAEIGHFVREWLARLPAVTTEFHDCLPGRPNVVARLQGVSDAPPLAFLAHMDTVPVGDGWSRDPFGAEIADGRLYGRGAADMKAGLAVTMMAMADAAMRGRPPSRTLLLCATVDEEVEMSGVGSLIDQGLLREDTLTVATEPTSLKIAVEHKGLMWIEVFAHGALAHAGNPKMGVDAIRAIAEFITRLQAAVASIGVTNSRLGEASVTFSGISGGIKTNVVPDLARVEMDIRLPPPLTITEVKELLEQCLRAAERTVPGARLRYRQMDRQRPPVQADLDGPLLRGMRAAMRDIPAIAIPTTPDDTLYCGFPAYSDASMLQSRTGNRQCVLFGPGALAQAHTVDEFLEIAEIEPAAELLTGLASRLCFD
ncbi:M20 family metallopeptidase [Roseomonas mucosa]